MENPSNTTSKQKALETSGSAHALQVVTGMPSTPTVAGPTPATLAQTTPLPQVVGPMADPPSIAPLRKPQQRKYPQLH
ncbi:UNVERIFIED_CONTAM: hypothetical protein Sradi_6191300 [Sesamum radiatum]|uniref:Uncharacterized protein n=1 Tax=Sesamum radiatum TaxID=300843 RepID=A0AAW2KAJ3_SESRA